MDSLLLLSIVIGAAVVVVLAVAVWFGTAAAAMRKQRRKVDAASGALTSDKAAHALASGADAAQATDALQASRRNYNAQVRQYNAMLKRFPTKLFRAGDSERSFEESTGSGTAGPPRVQF